LPAPDIPVMITHLLILPEAQVPFIDPIPSM